MYRRHHNQTTGSRGENTSQGIRGQNRPAGKGFGLGQKRKWSPAPGNEAGPLKKAHHNHTHNNGQAVQYLNDANWQTYRGGTHKEKGQMDRGGFTAANRNDSTSQYNRPNFTKHNPPQRFNQQITEPHPFGRNDNHGFKQRGQGRGGGRKRGGYPGDSHVQNETHSNHPANNGTFTGSQNAHSHHKFFATFPNPHNQARPTQYSATTISNQTARGDSGSNFSNINHFQNGATQSIPWAEQQNTRNEFNGRGRGRDFGRYGNRGGQFTPINPFQRAVPLEHIDVIDYDNYDADSSCDTDYGEGYAVAGKIHHHTTDCNFANPLTQVLSKLDSVLFHLINNTPQYKSTLSRFMDGYTGPDDLEFWTNTLGVEHMNWEVLHEVERLGLQMPPGWKCAVREFEERRMEANIYKEKHASVTTDLHNPSVPGRASDAGAYNLRPERHGGTWAEPITTTYQLSSPPSPAAAKEHTRPTLPGTQKAFTWTTPETPHSFQSTSQPVDKLHNAPTSSRSPKAFTWNTPQTPCSFQSGIQPIQPIPLQVTSTPRYRFGA